MTDTLQWIVILTLVCYELMRWFVDLSESKEDTIFNLHSSLEEAKCDWDFDGGFILTQCDQVIKDKDDNGDAECPYCHKPIKRYLRIR